MNPVSYQDLTVFLAIARHKSFRRAADELGCTPSALSHALRQIEERLNLRLFNRTTRSVALTEVGDRLFSRIAPALSEHDNPPRRLLLGSMGYKQVGNQLSHRLAEMISWADVTLSTDFAAGE